MIDRKRKQFVEDFGVFFERVGLTRMAGRILGWLLICDPPHQSSQELAQAIQASKGSISTNARALTQIGLVERVSLPGERRTYYVVRDGVWSSLMRSSMAELAQFRKMAERGLALLEGEPEELQRRLKEMHSLYSFFEREFPSLLERWERGREAQG